ncbi:MAG: hypothetical protein HQL44_17210 [Alphaproteobacteria bacterium]|nr:hypothetical protein [Alphaproteobacteria bacterium]
MSVETSADRLAMLADFGVTATLDGIEVTVLFEEEQRLINFDDAQAGLSVIRPSAVLSTATVGNAGEGSDLSVADRTWRVAQRSDDGLGFTTLFLNIA